MAIEPFKKGTREMQEAHRERIQTGNLISRLQKNALGELICPQTKEPIEMTAGQIKSAEILLKKTLPDLKAVEITGDALLDILVQAKIAPSYSQEEWGALLKSRQP
jgi:hypothetical protein